MYSAAPKPTLLPSLNSHILVFVRNNKYRCALTKECGKTTPGIVCSAGCTLNGRRFFCFNKRSNCFYNHHISLNPAGCFPVFSKAAQKKAKRVTPVKCSACAKFFCLTRKNNNFCQNRHVSVHAQNATL